MIILPNTGFARSVGTSSVDPGPKATRKKRQATLPLIARSIAEQALLPLGVPAMLLVFVLILRRAAAETASAGWHSAAQPIK